ncbi:MAG: hypothetical protein ACOYK6_02550 [Chthoniobacterales bacterium]
MNQPQIIGIVLVRNEECFVEQVICNIFSFCDRLLLVDHESSDGTLAILQRFQQEHPEKIALHRIHHPRESHELLKPFVGTRTWVFGVDGDELYDPERLMLFRERLLSGEFDREWMILGNVLHVEKLEGATAAGYLTPPSRSITKLYNFGAIESWEGETLERLHGGNPVFRPGFHEQKKRKLFEEEAWDAASLRCLHLCFIPRSRNTLTKVRKNIMETYSRGLVTSMKNKIRLLARDLLGVSEDSSWKNEHYARGERHVKDATPFLKNTRRNGRDEKMK